MPNAETVPTKICLKLSPRNLPQNPSPKSPPRPRQGKSAADTGVSVGRCFGGAVALRCRSPGPRGPGVMVQHLPPAPPRNHLTTARQRPGVRAVLCRLVGDAARVESDGVGIRSIEPIQNCPGITLAAIQSVTSAFRVWWHITRAD